MDNEYKQAQMIKKLEKVVKDKHILQTFSRVRRHMFVPVDYRDQAYDDTPLPIGYEQTISQPTLVAQMIEQLHIHRDDTILEIGTGSGYEAAIIACLCKKVITIEYINALAITARSILKYLKYANITVIHADGKHGYPTEAPYNGIIIAAAATSFPYFVFEQLLESGIMVFPLKIGEKEYLIQVKKLYPVRFVPLV